MDNEDAEQWSAPLMAVAKTSSHLLFQQNKYLSHSHPAIKNIQESTTDTFGK